jgi:hypothetical protein
VAQDTSNEKPAAAAVAPAQRGLKFSPFWAQLLLWSMLFLGVGVLALLKLRVAHRGPAEPPPPAAAPPPIEEEPAVPAAHAPAVKAPPPPAATEVNLEDDGTEPAPAPKKAAPRPARKAPRSRHESPQEINLE